MSKALSLLDYCQEETTIECSTRDCVVYAKVNTDALEAVDTYYAEGWRSRKGFCYCPKCSKELGLLIKKI